MVQALERYTFGQAVRRLQRPTAELSSHRKMVPKEGWSDEISAVLQSLVIQAAFDLDDYPDQIGTYDEVMQWLLLVELIQQKLFMYDISFKLTWLDAFKEIERYLYGPTPKTQEL